MTKKTERRTCEKCKFRHVCLVHDHIDAAFFDFTYHCTTVKGADKARTIFNKFYREIAKLCKLYKKGK